MGNLGRAIVRSQPMPIFEAGSDGVLHLIVPAYRIDGEDNSAAIIIGVGPADAVAADVIEIPYGGESNPVLPSAKMFPVALTKGQVLWAVSGGETLVSFSWIPDEL
jgi:hypothetical protein